MKYGKKSYGSKGTFKTDCMGSYGLSNPASKKSGNRIKQVYNTNGTGGFKAKSTYSQGYKGKI